MSADRRLIEPSLEKKISESLISCWKEGVAAQVMIGIFDYYLTPFALFLGASTQQIGLLVAIPNILSSMSQFFSVRAVSLAGSRLKLMLTLTGIQLFFLLAIGLLPFFQGHNRIALLVLLVSVFRVLGSLIGPAWGSLVSEYLPEHRRGQYFGWRARIIGIAGIVGMAFWGVVLWYLKRFSSTAAFATLFLSAVVFRMFSYFYFSKMTDLNLHTHDTGDLSLWSFTRRFRENNIAKFIFYVASVTFAANVAAPYFSVYMLKDLQFDYLKYMIIQLSSTLAGLIAFPIWGRHADHVGNVRILKITGFLVAFAPLLWLFSAKVGWLSFAEMVSGFLWGGFNLCVTNFIYDAVNPGRRVVVLSFFNLVNSGAIFLGALLGGALSSRLPSLFGSPLLSLFLVSAVLRFLADFFLSRYFKEVRNPVQKVETKDLFYSVVGLRPLVGRNNEWVIMPSFSIPRFISKRQSSRRIDERTPSAP